MVERSAAELADRLMLVSSQLARGMRLSEDTIRLTGSQREVLTLLVKSGAASPAQMVAELGKHATAIARTLAELQQRGYIARTVDTEDRRRFIIDITDAGRRAHDAVLSSRVVPLAGQLTSLDNASVEVLQRALDLIESLVKKE